METMNEIKAELELIVRTKQEALQRMNKASIEWSVMNEEIEDAKVAISDIDAGLDEEKTKEMLHATFKSTTSGRIYDAIGKLFPNEWQPDSNPIPEPEEPVYVTDNNQIGYLAEGEPTDIQLKLQDAFDNLTQTYLQGIQNLHTFYTGQPDKEVEWDIGKIFRVREEAEEVLGLNSLY